MESLTAVGCYLCWLPPLVGVTFIQVPPLLGCHLQSLLLSASSIQVPLLLRCHLQPPLLGATFLQIPPLPGATSNHLCVVPSLFRCHLYLGATTSTQVPPLLGQMPPKLGSSVCLDATSSWVPPLHRGPLSPTCPQQPPLSFRAPPPLGWTKQPKASNAQQHPQGGIFFLHPLPPWAGTLFGAGAQEAAPAGALTTARLWGWDTSLSIPGPGHTAQLGG